MNRKEIPIVASEKHLGNHIGENAQENHIEMSIRELYSNTNMLITQFGNVDTSVKYSLMKTFCMSLYGSSLWNYENIKIMQRFLIAWRKCLKRLLDISVKTHSKYLYAVVNDIPVEIQLHRRFVKFIRDCSYGNSCTQLCVQLILYGSRSNACSSINHISHLYGLNRNALLQYNDCELRSKLNSVFSTEVLQHSACIKDFLDFRYANKALYSNISEIITHLCELDV